MGAARGGRSRRLRSRRRCRTIPRSRNGDAWRRPATCSAGARRDVDAGLHTPAATAAVDPVGRPGAFGLAFGGSGRDAGGPKARAANRFRRMSEKLIAHNSAHLRTIPHYFAHDGGFSIVRRGVDGLAKAARGPARGGTAAAADAATGFAAHAGGEAGTGGRRAAGREGDGGRGFVRGERRCPWDN